MFASKKWFFFFSCLSFLDLYDLQREVKKLREETQKQHAQLIELIKKKDN